MATDIPSLLGPTLKGKSGDVETASLAGPGRFVGLYFSAHWCPPCRQFTPMLAEFYKKFKERNGDKLEIVFLSSDQSEDQFNSYYAEMPWLSLPFANGEIKKAVSGKFGVRGIPTFIILESETGEIVCTQARNEVMDDPEGEDFPWAKK